MAEVLDLDPDKPAVEFLDYMGFSAHALAHPDGTITRCRGDNEGAYHAKDFNLESLGIEILVPGTWTYGPWVERIKTDWVTDVQYQSALWVVLDWMVRYSIELVNVVRHSDIDPTRKVDPGDGFPWLKFKDDLKLRG